MYEKKRLTVFAFPARIICISFFAVILIGTILLMMPFSSYKPTSFLDALFTATSATCVTGLVVYDTYTHWTVAGQIIILTLIQIGGLGLVTFTTFFNVLIGKKLGLRGMQLAQESISSVNFIDITKIVKMIVLISIFIELSGALVMCIAFVPKYGFGEGIFISIFLAISAFCNAGFDVLGREGMYASLTNYNGNLAVMLTIPLLIIIGGLGFVVWHDLIMYHKTKKLMLHTKIVLVVTGILIVLGTFMFLICEWNNPLTMSNMSFLEKFEASLFQSVTTRTAGFNTVDIPSLNGITKIFSMILMFIGAAPGSTGGGVKVSTFAVLFMSVICVIRGLEETVIMKRKVSKNVVYKALAIVIIAITAISLSAGIMYYTLGSVNVTGIDAFFEAVSAFATVGISAGVTGVANVPSKIVLILSMFLGRVGPVSFALSLAMRSRGNKKEILPEGKIIVG